VRILTELGFPRRELEHVEGRHPIPSTVFSTTANVDTSNIATVQIAVASAQQQQL